jgi:hypothetical protein
MFVRWKIRTLRKPHWAQPDQAFYAVLAESRRVNGRPRQKIVKYLSSIREQEMRSPIYATKFWRQVESALASLVLDPATRQKVETALSRRVARPTHAELAQAQRDWRRVLDGLGMPNLAC